MAVLHCGVFIIGCLVLFFLSRKKPDVLRKRVFNFGLFLLLFLIVGSLANGIWGCLIYNRLYHSVDYIFDFTPFWPVTLNVDRPHVEGYGTTPGQLNAIWFTFAAFTWAVTVALYRLSHRKLQKARSNMAANLEQ